MRSKRTLITLVLLMLVLAIAAVPAFAQATPVPIVVDTNSFITSANTWITSLAPIIAIGVGIAIAIALLTFIGQQILKAFKGSGK